MSLSLFLKRIFIVIFFLATSTAAFSQNKGHVQWKVDSVTKGTESEKQLFITGTIDEGWSVYDVSKAMELPGVKISAKTATVAVKDVQILSPKVDLDDIVFGTKMKVFQKEIKLSATLTTKTSFEKLIQVKIQYDLIKKDAFESEEPVLKVATEVASINPTDTTVSVSAIPDTAAKFQMLIPSIDLKNPLTDCGLNSSAGTTDTKGKGLLTIFFLGFLGGLLALITPCVFPMIPLTVSFFTKKSGSRREGIKNAFTYGFFIFFIYILLSLPFHFLQSLNPAILNNISTNVYLNVIFFVVFVVFALSFFGLFEITLPSSISNKADSKSGSKNILGIFFMALTLAIVSFSCTGPILGTLLAGSLSGDGGAMQLTAGMGGFGLALALPFALFALFPHWLNSLPKSGGWLSSVKIVLGFAELALALKFLSNADLVMHWGLLKREVFIGIWIIISALLALYLFNIIKFKHDSPPKKLSAFRIGLAVLVTAFTLYLIPGVTNTKYANLSLISGFPPPLWNSIYQKDSDCILNLNCTHDYNEGLRMAKEQNKPILLDFTGYACVNCRKMEENVWVQPEIYNVMKENYIVVSLYVDDKKELPLEQQFTYKSKNGSEKEIITVGDKWATFETENFGSNAQPWYAIINSKEQLLSHPLGYANTKKLEEEYLAWLLCGVEAAKK